VEFIAFPARGGATFQKRMSPKEKTRKLSIGKKTPFSKRKEDKGGEVFIEERNTLHRLRGKRARPFQWGGKGSPRAKFFTWKRPTLVEKREGYWSEKACLFRGAAEGRVIGEAVEGGVFEKGDKDRKGRVLFTRRCPGTEKPP